MLKGAYQILRFPLCPFAVIFQKIPRHRRKRPVLDDGQGFVQVHPIVVDEAHDDVLAEGLAGADGDDGDAEAFVALFLRWS